MILSALSDSALITAISTVGFPIVMCGALFWYIQKENMCNREKIEMKYTVPL